MLNWFRRYIGVMKQVKLRYRFLSYFSGTTIILVLSRTRSVYLATWLIHSPRYFLHCEAHTDKNVMWCLIICATKRTLLGLQHEGGWDGVGNVAYVGEINQDVFGRTDHLHSFHHNLSNWNKYTKALVSMVKKLSTVQYKTIQNFKLFLHGLRIKHWLMLC
jgi:hypothetical protein